LPTKEKNRQFGSGCFVRRGNSHFDMKFSHFDLHTTRGLIFPIFGVRNVKIGNFFAAEILNIFAQKRSFWNIFDHFCQQVDGF